VITNRKLSFKYSKSLLDATQQATELTIRAMREQFVQSGSYPENPKALGNIGGVGEVALFFDKSTNSSMCFCVMLQCVL
jgi:hypothetical protein